MPSWMNMLKSRARLSRAAKGEEYTNSSYNGSDNRHSLSFAEYIQEFEREQGTRSPGPSPTEVGMAEAPNSQLFEAPHAENHQPSSPRIGSSSYETSVNGFRPNNAQAATQPIQQVRRQSTNQQRKYTSALNEMKCFKTVFLFHDSISMQEEENIGTAYKFLEVFYPYAVEYGGPQNVEIRFTSDGEYDLPLKRLSKENFYRRLKPGDCLQLANALKRIMDPFERKVKRDAMPSEKHRGLNIICITNGEDPDRDAVAVHIRGIADRLSRKETALNMAGYQFVHIGDNEEGKLFCEWLDDKLPGRDIVDMIHYDRNEEITEKLKAKVLQGGVNKTLDREASRNT